MEFIAGIVFTLAVGYVGYKIYTNRKERKSEGLPPRKSGLDGK